MPNTVSSARYTNPAIIARHSEGGDESGRIGHLAFTDLGSGSSSTLKPYQMLDGIVRVRGGTTHTATTPTAAQLLAYYPGAVVGSAFTFGVRNDNSGTFTLSAGSNVTNSGTATALTTVWRLWKGYFTNVSSGTEAVTLIDA